MLACQVTPSNILSGSLIFGKALAISTQEGTEVGH